MQRALGVIPARYASTRFRGKLLAPLAGRTLLEQVWRKACGTERIERIIVATDDERILEACGQFGAEAMMTSTLHRSGTDRVAEVVEAVGPRYGLVVNIQGDEPLVTGSSLDSLVASFDVEAPPAMATLAEPLTDVDDLFDPNVVKLVTGSDGRALYFSRSPIPYFRGDGAAMDLDFRSVLAGRREPLSGYRKHQGIYAYTRETVLRLTAMPPSELEISERLEQLRALQAGYGIQVVDSDFCSIGVDTPADLERVQALYEQRRSETNA